MLEQIQKKHFSQLPPLNLIWGLEGKRGQRKTIRLASFWPERMEIRLHPFLKDPRIPEYYLKYLLFHELCHAHLMSQGETSESHHHNDEFYRLEKRFESYQKATLWEEEHLSEILSEHQD
ncbi:MAG: hypothetical protein HQL32_01085 [Planctomycetes bacterium]|nr:hypothetical protein [Planctomycetota bacterium]